MSGLYLVKIFLTVGISIYESIWSVSVNLPVTILLAVKPSDEHDRTQGE